MIDLELSWQEAAFGACGLAVGSAALRLACRERLRRAGPAGAESPADAPGRAGWWRRAASAAVLLQESALVLALFALWQYAGSFAVMGPGGALARSRLIWHVERVLRLPSETAVQRLFLPHPLLVQACNLYYDSLHFPVLIACMVWLFVRYRDRYAAFRTTLVLFTGLCLLIQLIPVAPPRMLPETGMIDTAIRYGQSMYGTHAGFNADQLSAMPSVHVGWAILIAIMVISAASTPWRWLALLYPAATTLVVVVTANHFWLDGIVAAIVLALVLAAQAVARRLLMAGRLRLELARAARAPGPVPVPVGTEPR